jgi:predicted kinase
MILTIRGTHGSGKSTLVRTVLGKYQIIIPDYEGWRERPAGYLCQKEGLQDLWIQGPYEITCGGCDTFTDINEAYEGVTEHHEKGENVLFEGILAQHSRWNIDELILQFGIEKFKVIVLTTPLEDCIASVNGRRAERGKGIIDPRNIKGEARGVELAAKRLEMKGVTVWYLDRQEALQKSLELLGWS